MAGHHIIRPRYYLINFALITCLMIATVVFGTAESLDFGHPNGWNLLIALVIAVMKTLCIASVFMGVWWSKKIIQLFAVSGFVWLVIMFVFVLVDYANPVDSWGTPYVDALAPGTSPLPTGGETSMFNAAQVVPGGEH